MSEPTRLSTDLIEAAWRTYDYSEGYAEAWDFMEAVECDECGATIIYGNPEEHGPWAEDERMPCPQEDFDFRDLGAEGPMMSGLWPMEGDADKTARLLAGLPFCAVMDAEHGDLMGIALTGGGMDLSWEIAEAYIRCGFYPPATVRLPAMCGRGADGYSPESIERDGRIVEAVVRSNEILAGWASSRIEDARRAGSWVNR